MDKGDRDTFRVEMQLARECSPRYVAKHLFAPAGMRAMAEAAERVGRTARDVLIEGDAIAKLAAALERAGHPMAAMTVLADPEFFLRRALEAIDALEQRP